MIVTYVTHIRGLTRDNIRALDNLSMAGQFARPTSTDRASVRTYCVSPGELAEQLNRIRRTSQSSIARPIYAVIRKLEGFTAEVSGEWLGEQVVGHVKSNRQTRPGRPVETVELPARETSPLDFARSTCFYCDVPIVANTTDLGSSMLLWLDQQATPGTGSHCPVSKTHRHTPKV